VAAVDVLRSNSLTVTRAEDWIRRLDHAAQGRTAVLLDLTGCRNIDSGAGWRIGNALRRFAAPDGRCDVIVEPPGDFSDWWFLHYTRSGLGHSLADYASTIKDTNDEDITKNVRSYYQSKSEHTGSTIKGVYGNSTMQALVPNEEYFYGRFDSWVDELFGRRRTDEAMVTKQLRTLAWEAVTNVVDHSWKQPLPPATRTLSSLTMRWYRAASVASSPGHARWVSHLRAASDGRPLGGLVDLVISDDGVGLAGRQALDLAVYRGPIENELNAVAAGLKAGTTVKLRAHDAEVRGTPGYGFTYIIDTIRKLNAWALLRTGRIALEFDGTSSGTDGFVLRDRTLAYLPGTTIEVTVPIFDAQFQLPLG
jgi:hypothetical protein